MIETAPVRHYATIDSTNLEARRLFDAATRGPLWLLADEQTAGRGRLNRGWVSAPGNLYATLLLPVAAPQKAVPQIGFVAALAVQRTVAMFAPAAPVVLKWPNDCLANGAKISGILCEAFSAGVVAIGCGINVAQAPQGLSYPATCLRTLGSAATVSDVFAAFRGELAAAVALWNDGAGFSAIRGQWQSRAAGMGERVALSTGEVMVEGVFEGIGDDGALVIAKADGKRHVFHVGDLCIPSLQPQRRQSA